MSASIFRKQHSFLTNSTSTKSHKRSRSYETDDAEDAEDADIWRRKRAIIDYNEQREEEP